MAASMPVNTIIHSIRDNRVLQLVVKLLCLIIGDCCQRGQLTYVFLSTCTYIAQLAKKCAAFV